jgi:septal ring factor EnvC (AmiA/AmiB activator)
MSRNGDEDDATLRLDDKSNTNDNEEGSKTRSSIDAKVEDLMKRLEKLTAKNNKLRRKVKSKRTKGGSSSREEEDSSYEEKDSKKGKNGRNNRISLPITQCISIMIMCLALPPTPPYSLAKLSTLMELVITNRSIA